MSLTDRGILKLLKRLEEIGKEIKSIAHTGAEALTSTTNRNLFIGMHHSLDKIYERFERKVSEIMEFAEENDIEDVPDANMQFFIKEVKTCYYNAHGYYDQLKSPQLPIATTNVVTVSRPKLPPISIKPFKGQISEWLHFKQVFTALVLKDTALSNIERFKYLLSFVEGQAHDKIKNIPFDEEHFEQAWSCLDRLYSNERKLACHYVDKLLSLKPQPGKPTFDSLHKYHTQVKDIVHAFSCISLPAETNLGDYLICELSLRGMDSITRDEFETFIADKDKTFPTQDDLDKFLQRRCQALMVQNKKGFDEPLASASKFGTGKSKASIPSPKAALVTTTAKGRESVTPASSGTCPPCHICSKPHLLFRCPEFSSATPQDRAKMLKSWRGCWNCLYSSHFTRNCPSKSTCRECGKLHHTLLHFPKTAPPNSTTPSTSATVVAASDTTAASKSSSMNVTASNAVTSKSNCLFASAAYEVLLGTATAQIQDVQGLWHEIRLIIDCGSQSSFITHDLRKKLRLPLLPTATSITGIGQTNLPKIEGKVKCVLLPNQYGALPISATALVVAHIIAPTPSDPVPISVQDFFRSFNLADPGFARPGTIDLLIGADLYSDLITGKPVSVNQSAPRLIPTVFGHIVIGPYCVESNCESPTSVNALFTTCQTATTQPDLKELITRFWEVEEVSDTKPLTPAEQAAESHFCDTHYRLSNGRYVVGLAFQEGGPKLGPSKPQAERRFLNLEKSFSKNPDCKEAYTTFIQEYEDLGHLRKSTEEGTYYIPHHSVYKGETGHGKIRVVFDASAKTASGSLNDWLIVGPKLQQDVCIVLLNFRRHFIAFTADIVKMYRQILMRPTDCAYLHILWREKPTQPLQDFTLNTITYGLSNSPFLALRTLKQLTEDEGDPFPLAVKIIRESCYIDDLNGGGSSFQEALAAKTQLVELLRRGGFTLGKWASNCPALMHKNDNAENEPVNLPEETTAVSILGLYWDQADDVLSYKVQNIDLVVSRRGILSVIARLYDPLGLLAPTTFNAKVLMQETWQNSELSWDDPVPVNLANRWLCFAQGLTQLTRIRLPRCLLPQNHTDTLFVGFCDASSKGYCAVFYLVAYSASSSTSCLLKAKTKLAPLKSMLTIPRLELCGAVLLVRLFRSLKGFFKNFPTTPVVFFTDSSNVLGWLTTPVNSLLTFAAHRVSEILETTTLDQWRHVRTEDNPADVGSRGLNPSQLVDHSLWWQGPTWLQQPMADWPLSSVDVNRTNLPELKRKVAVTLAAATEVNSIVQWIDHFRGSSDNLPQLIRIIAYIYRFINSCRSKPTVDRSIVISCKEYSHAHKRIIRLVQEDAYPEAFERGTTSTSFLRSLNVFLDNDFILRVGGRLQKSSLRFSVKHPILLPKKGRFTTLIVHYYHRICLHAGSAAVLYALQQTYWLPGGRNLVKRMQRSCSTCLRFNAQPKPPFMSDLPANRINPSNPFDKVGIDYAGPFLCKSSRLRRAPVEKSYLCIFICLATKAVHLELSEALSTDAFLDAFERFVARRGLPSEVFSDCGTNFRGAASYLEEISIWLSAAETKERFVNFAAPRNIRWTFNPPHAPHFGGIWESQIKTAKALLRKTLGSYTCTSGELSTMFIRIEAIMNSRPLYALSTDPHDMEVLTPAHFLIGRPLNSLPEPNFADIPENHLRRWQWIRQRTQYFWSRWQTEYLQTLQARQKWHTHHPNLQVNDLVLLAEDNLPPLNWPLGRITRTFPGSDGIVRVVKVKTAHSECTRPVTKIVKLTPLQQTPTGEP